MILNVFYVFFLLVFVKQLFKKWGIYDKLNDYAGKTQSEILYKVITCDFCLHFWVCVALTILVAFAVGLSFNLLLVPFIVSGLDLFFKRK